MHVFFPRIRPATAALSCAALLLIVGAPAASAQQPGRAADTDQTIKVARGTQLLIENFAGEVVLRAWPRDEVRVQARHTSRVKVAVRQSDNRVRVNSSSEIGTSSVDYDISAPAWIGVRISGTFNYVQVDGIQADISIETVRGDIRVKGGQGVIALESIEGEVHVEDAGGRLRVSSVNEGVTIRRATGTVSAETVNGDILILDAKTDSAEATTVNGDIRYAGVVTEKGLYRFNTHNGDIVMDVPDRINATVSVRSYDGDFKSTLVGPAADLRRGRRQTYTLGTGAAQIELESFGGGIRLRRLSEVPAEQPKKDERD